MEREEIAERISMLIWDNCSNRDIFAVQLFIEDLCVPKEITNYSQVELSNYILNYINKNFQ